MQGSSSPAIGSPRDTRTRGLSECSATATGTDVDLGLQHCAQLLAERLDLRLAGSPVHLGRHQPL